MVELCGLHGSMELQVGVVNYQLRRGNLPVHIIFHMVASPIT